MDPEVQAFLGEHEGKPSGELKQLLRGKFNMSQGQAKVAINRYKSAPKPAAPTAPTQALATTVGRMKLNYRGVAFWTPEPPKKKESADQRAERIRLNYAEAQARTERGQRVTWISPEEVGFNLDLWRSRLNTEGAKEDWVIPVLQQIEVMTLPGHPDHARSVDEFVANEGMLILGLMVNPLDHLRQVARICLTIIKHCGWGDSQIKYGSESTTGFVSRKVVVAEQCLPLLTSKAMKHLDNEKCTEEAIYAYRGLLTLHVDEYYDGITRQNVWNEFFSKAVDRYPKSLTIAVGMAGLIANLACIQGGKYHDLVLRPWKYAGEMNFMTMIFWFLEQHVSPTSEVLPIYQAELVDYSSAALLNFCGTHPHHDSMWNEIAIDRPKARAILREARGRLADARKSLVEYIDDALEALGQ